MSHTAADRLLLKGNEIGASANQFSNPVVHDQQLKDPSTSAVAGSPAMPTNASFRSISIGIAGFAGLRGAIKMLDIARQIGLAKDFGVWLVADLTSGTQNAHEPLSQHRADGVSDHLRR